MSRILTTASSSSDNWIQDPFDFASGTYSYIILDWDDSLFPSTWLLELRGELDNQALTLISKVELAVLKLFSALRQNQWTQLVIVTNARCGWVEFCAQTFMPSLYELLNAMNIPIHSARDCYPTGSSNPLSKNRANLETPDFNPDKWKIRMFEVLLRGQLDKQDIDSWSAVTTQSTAVGWETATHSFESWVPPYPCAYGIPNPYHGWAGPTAAPHKWANNDEYHLISIGDSQSERKAMLYCRERLYAHNRYFKSIKLIELPDPLILIRQLTYLYEALDKILRSKSCFDIILGHPSGESVPP